MSVLRALGTIAYDWKLWQVCINFSESFDGSGEAAACINMCGLCTKALAGFSDEFLKVWQVYSIDWHVWPMYRSFGKSVEKVLWSSRLPANVWKVYGYVLRTSKSFGKFYWLSDKLWQAQQDHYVATVQKLQQDLEKYLPSSRTLASVQRILLGHMENLQKLQQVCNKPWHDTVILESVLYSREVL